MLAGLKHARGILLYGPPGTGKTLIARQIGKMLHAREPKIVNGPSILDKYVGESEANIRKLFEDAEKEFKQAGLHSALHIIIFDEIDAICKARGSTVSSNVTWNEIAQINRGLFYTALQGAGSAVHDTVVNQLLSKMDGVDQLNNILVIGMTNRRDMIDEALLRPGRMEVQMEIGLPDEKGRVQILNIHTSSIRESGKLDPDVNIEELATQTKNFSGAEIEGLCRAAASSALNEKIKVSLKERKKRMSRQKLVTINWLLITQLIAINYTTQSYSVSHLKPALFDYLECSSISLKAFQSLNREHMLLRPKSMHLSFDSPTVMQACPYSRCHDCHV